MSSSETSISCIPNARITWTRITRAGDDRRRAPGVEAGDPKALGEGQRGEPAEHPLDPLHRRAGSRAPGRGRRARAPGRSPPARSACPATAIARLAFACGCAAIARSIRLRMSAARSSSSCGSGGSEVRWRSEWRIVPGLERGVEVDLGAGADDQLGRAAADVEDERLLLGRADGRWRRGR